MGLSRGNAEQLGFSRSWIDKKMCCVTTISFSFLINCEIGGSIKPSRELRPSDLISPYLFLICDKKLSQLILEAECRRDIAGFCCSREGLKLSHLFFTDNSMSFTRANEKDCIAIKEVLECYTLASGQLLIYKNRSCALEARWTNT